MSFQNLLASPRPSKGSRSQLYLTHCDHCFPVSLGHRAFQILAQLACSSDAAEPNSGFQSIGFLFLAFLLIPAVATGAGTS